MGLVDRWTGGLVDFGGGLGGPGGPGGPGSSGIPGSPGGLCKL